MKLLDFNILTGWPASASTFKFMQEQLLQLQMLSLLGGTNYILSGCVNVGGTVGDGLVVINGEVLPFVGGAAQDNVIIVDMPTSRSFFSGALNPYYHDRVAQFGTSTDPSLQYAWASFEKNVPTNGLLTRMRIAEELLTGLRSDLNNQIAAFNAYEPAWADITDKPVGLITYTGSISLGDIGSGASRLDNNNSLYTITIPNQGASSYMVAGSIRGLSTSPIADGSIMWTCSSLSATEFKLLVSQISGVQNLQFDFAIIKTS